MNSDFAGLNDASHLTAQTCILARSAFSSSAALIHHRVSDGDIR